MEFKNISDRDEYGTIPPRSNGQMVISAKKDIVETRTFCHHGDVTSHFSLFRRRNSGSFPVGPGSNLMRARTASREVWPIRGEHPYYSFDLPNILTKQITLPGLNTP